MTSAKNVFLEHNTCAAVLNMCLGHVTTIELRDESYATGMVVEVDGFMNVTLQDATYLAPTGKFQKQFSDFFIHNRRIRYAQIPPEINIGMELEKKYNSSNGGRGRGRGRGKIAISNSRKSILAKREARRREDLENALKFKAEQAARKEPKN